VGCGKTANGHVFTAKRDTRRPPRCWVLALQLTQLTDRHRHGLMQGTLVVVRGSFGRHVQIVHHSHRSSHDPTPSPFLASPPFLPCLPPCSAARASQEFVGIFLALLMLGVEVLDYVNWARECYHRRLTMVDAKESNPPLYPIPGEP
jgi:hypothetical protein